MKQLFYLMLSLPLLVGYSKDNDDDNKVKIGKDFTEKVSGVELEMVYVKGGTFCMGAMEEQGDEAWNREKPAHEVTLSDYYIGKFEVTQGVWEKVMGITLEQWRAKSDYNNECCGIGSDCPMYYVNWEEAQEFCKKLSELTGKRYALPTEAQWVYAARGGVKSKGYKYSGSNDDCCSSTRPVGTKQPNELGLYGMNGNVWEWCRDWCGSYGRVVQTDPIDPSSGSDRVSRGRRGNRNARCGRVSYRNGNYPSNRCFNRGFRVVLLP